MTTTLILGFVFIHIVLFIILPIFVYYDAQRHEIDNPSKWAAIVLFTAGTGILLYFFERDDAKHGGKEADSFALPGSSNADRTTSNSGTDAEK